MLKTYITFLSILFFFILLYSCKTSESSQSSEMNEQEKQLVLQSSIDTASLSVLSPEELNRIKLMAQEGAKLYCNLKQFDDKNLKDPAISEAYNKIDVSYRNHKFKVDELDSMGKMEYDRIFEESKAKCD